MGSTPLAMLAATCNKIGSPSPSPSSISDNSSSFGKGFHPWKRAAASSCSLGSSLSSFTRNGGGLSDSFGTNTSTGSSAFSLTSGTSSNSHFGNDYSVFQASVSNNSQEPSHQPMFISKVHTSVDSLQSIYPRMSVAHPYESWFKSSHPGIPTGDVGTTGASAWWDVGAGWIDVQNPNGAALQTSLHSGGLQTSLHSPLGGYNSDYSSLSHSAFSTSASPHLLTTGQHLMDGFKPVLSSYPDSSPSPLGGAGGSMLTGGPTASLAGSPRSSARRYSGRATCDCPNCQEAERLGPAGASQYIFMETAWDTFPCRESLQFSKNKHWAIIVNVLCVSVYVCV